MFSLLEYLLIISIGTIPMFIEIFVVNLFELMSPEYINNDLKIVANVSHMLNECITDSHIICKF